MLSYNNAYYLNINIHRLFGILPIFGYILILGWRKTFQNFKPYLKIKIHPYLGKRGIVKL